MGCVCGLVVVRWPWVSGAVGCGLSICGGLFWVCGGLPIWVLGLGYGVADLGFGFGLWGWRWRCFVDELFWVY